MRLAFVKDCQDVRPVVAGNLASKRDLLHRLVKEVRVHDRRTIEVWYALPNPERFESWNKWLLGADSNHQPTG